MLDALRTALGSTHDGQDVGVGDMKADFFQHRGQAVRGVRATADIPEDGLILRVPEGFHMSAEDVQPLRFRVLREQSITSGLWLAEQKAHPRSKHWETFTKSLPTLEEYRAAGLPVGADPAELARLSSLPDVGPMARWVQKLHRRLAIDLHRYTKALRSELHTCPLPGADSWLPAKPMSYDDALWGAISSVTRAFSRHAFPEVDYFIPGVDLLNHQRDANAGFAFEEPSGDFVVRALQPIQSGEEISIDYDPRAEPAEIWMRYGIPPVRTGIDPRSCKELCGADLGQGAFSEGLRALVDQRCKCKMPQQGTEPNQESWQLNGSVAGARFL